MIQFVHADAVIFSGSDVKTLKQNIDLFGVAKILSGTVDPSAGAGVVAPKGSIYLSTNGNLYEKFGTLDTEWSDIVQNPEAWLTAGNTIASGTKIIGNTNAGSMSLQGRINNALWMDMSGADRKFYGQSGQLALSFGSVGRKAYNTSSQETLDWQNGFLIDPSTATQTLNWINGYLFDAGGFVSQDWFNRTATANDGLTVNFDYSLPSFRLKWVNDSLLGYTGTNFNSDIMIASDGGFGKGNGAGSTIWALNSDGSASAANGLFSVYNSGEVKSPSVITGYLYDYSLVKAADVGNRQLFDTSGNYPSIDWGLYQLLNIGITNSSPMLDWSVSAGGSVKIYDGIANTVVGDFTNRQLNDAGGNVVVDWGLRVLRDNTNATSVDWDYHQLSYLGVLSLDWQNRTAHDTSGNSVFSYATNLEVSDAKNIVFGTTNGTKIGTATSQKFAFYNSTPIVQPGATTDLGTVLSNLGLRAAGTAYPISTSGNVILTPTAAAMQVVNGTGSDANNVLEFQNGSAVKVASVKGDGSASFGTNAAAASAILDASSTTKGFLKPRMTTTQRNAISSPATGLEVYDTDLKKSYYYNATAWKPIGGGMDIVANAAQTNASTLTPAQSASQVLQISGSGGAVTLADLGVTNALAGDVLVLAGTDSTNTVSLNSATNTVMNGAITLGDGDMITFIFFNSKWREQSRNN